MTSSEDGWQSVRLGALIYTIRMAGALIYLGEHYMLDLAVGGFFVVIGWTVADHLRHRLQKAPNP